MFINIYRFFLYSVLIFYSKFYKILQSIIDTFNTKNILKIRTILFIYILLKIYFFQDRISLVMFRDFENILINFLSNTRFIKYVFIVCIKWQNA